jgi:hypothetical protein
VTLHALSCYYQSPDRVHKADDQHYNGRRLRRHFLPKFLGEILHLSIMELLEKFAGMASSADVGIESIIYNQWLVIMHN